MYNLHLKRKEKILELDLYMLKVWDVSKINIFFSNPCKCNIFTYITDEIYSKLRLKLKEENVNVWLCFKITMLLQYTDL